MISNISKRYARAFFEIAAKDKNLEKYYTELNKFSSIIAQNKALGDFLFNPIFEQENKKKDAAFAGLFLGLLSLTYGGAFLGALGMILVVLASQIMTR